MRYADLNQQPSDTTKSNTLHKKKSHQSRVRSTSRDGGNSTHDFFQGMILPFHMLLRRWKFVLLVLVVLGIGLGSWYSFTALRSLNVKAQDLVGVPQAAVNFVTQKGPQLEHEDGRTNVLLLGIGGEGHDGPYLTDSIMVASVDIESGDAVLISLPRDIWITGARAKINAVYAFARQKEITEALPAAKTAVEEVLGIPIHYAVRIDFNGFTRAIDLLDGVEVQVARAFTDSTYPITGRENDMCGLKEVQTEIDVMPTPMPNGTPMPEATPYKQKVTQLIDAAGTDRSNDPKAFGCRYETISFQPGPIVLDGKTALKFVRSRHGTNNEGSDFARADRQQRVIEAFRNEVLSAGTLLNPGRVTSLIEEFGKSIEMDIKVTDYGEFIKLAQLTKDARIKTHTVTGEGIDALLVTPPSREPYGGAYVLIPKGGNWDVVHRKVQDWLSGIEPTPSPSAQSSSSPKINSQ